MKKGEMTTELFEKQLARRMGRSLTINEQLYLDRYLIKTALSMDEIIVVLEKAESKERKEVFTC